MACDGILALYPVLRDDHAIVVEIRQEYRHRNREGDITLSHRNTRYMTLKDLYEAFNSESSESLYWNRTYDDQIVVRTVAGQGFWTEGQ